MKKITKITILLSMAMVWSMAAMQAQELTKSFKESFEVKADAEVNISNKYGQVNIQSWDKNQVAVNVEVRVDAGSEKESQRVLDKINVKISGTNTSVKAFTDFSGKLDCKNCQLEIIYDVKMPATGSLVLANEFGNADVGSLQGNTDFTIAYGNLDLDELNGKNNIIRLKFGDAEASFLKAADVNVEYGNLEVRKAGYINLYSRFSGLEVGEVSELVIDSQYDGLELTSVDKVDGKAAFTGIEIGEVSDKMVLVSSYGEIEVDRVAGGFSLIDISTEFGGLELGIGSSASYKLSASTSFGEINFPEKNADITKQVEKSFEKEIEAFVGADKSSASVVRLKAKNCDIDID